MIKAYFKYRRQAVNEHKIHSPFVFEFYNEVIKKAKQVDDAYIQIVRSKLKKENRNITVNDLGQGSRKTGKKKRRISEMARVQAVSRKYGKLLSKIVEHYNLKDCLELGTSLGFGTAYLGMHAQRVFTIEGCENIHKEAIKAWDGWETNVQFILGEFSDVLSDTLSRIEKLDLVYIDGNHGYKPTIEYFEQVLAMAHNDTFIIFDDINWSEGMRRAWNEICQSDKINVSIELFRMGIVIKREEQAKEHFVLKF